MPNALSILLGLAGELHVGSIESPALKGNALGDPHVRPLIVYTPPGYDGGGSRRYPTLYCLHGFTSDAAAQLTVRPWETNVVQWFDRLIVEQRAEPALLVIVDGFTRLGGSQYVDSIHNGDYATYVARDIVGEVDEAYRTVAREGGRAIFGKSSGGFGALHLAMRFPGSFAAVAAHSADMSFRSTYSGDFAEAQRALEEYGGIAAFIERFESMHKRPQRYYAAISMLAYAAAYSPRAAKRWAIDLPFDERTGQLREGVFARWLAFDPVEVCAERRAELARLRLCYVDCGRRDEYRLDIGARIFVARLRDLGIEVRHEEFDDDHRNTGYRYETSLPVLSAVLDRS